jgi:hypothetical protein
MSTFDFKLIWSALLAYMIEMAISIAIGDAIGLMGWGVLISAFIFTPWMILAFVLFSYLKAELLTRQTHVRIVLVVAFLSFVLASLLFDAPDFSWIRRGPHTADWIYFRIFALYYTLWAVLYLFLTRPKSVS